MIHMGMTQEWIVFKERWYLFPSMATTQVVRRQFYSVISPLRLSKSVIQQSLLFPRGNWYWAEKYFPCEFALHNYGILSYWWKTSHFISYLQSLPKLSESENIHLLIFFSLVLFNLCDSSIPFSVYIRGQCSIVMGVKTPMSDRFGFV